MALNYIAIGKRIKAIRKKKGLSQMTLSEKVYCSPTYISYIESGERSMSLETLVMIANALNVSADEILVDNLSNTVKVSNHILASVLSDCNEYERKVLIDTVISVKASMREHKRYFHSHK